MSAETNTASSTPALHDMSAKDLLAYGDCLQVDENYQDAVDAYAAALALFRESEAAMHVRTLSHRSASFYQLERYPEALEDAQEALVMMSDQKPAGLYASEGEMVHRRLGMAAFQMAKYQDARGIFEKAAQLATLNRRARVDKFYAEWMQMCDDKMKKQVMTASSKAADPPKATVTPMKSSTNAPAAAMVSPKPTSSTAATRAPTVTPHVSRTVTSAPKYQYYQSDKYVTVSILEARVSEEDLNVRFEPKHLVATLRKGGKDFTIIAGTLYQEIDVDNSKINIKDEKVLIKLRKVEEGYEWPELMGKAIDSKPSVALSSKKATAEDTNTTDDLTPQKTPTVPKDSSKPRPYASHRDWDAIEKSIEEEEKNDKPQGDEAMNKLFQQIYANASEDTRRAMVKSYQTSGGTCLSTNWDEVKEKDYEKERTAPKGQEWKTWEGQKIPQKDDD
jgi:suppressor of G2 allele of SKP1